MHARQGNAVVIGVVIAAAIIVALGGGYFYLRSRSSTASTKNAANTSDTSSNNDASYSGSLDQLSSNGQAKECTFTTNTSQGSGEGHNFSDGKGKARLTINTTSKDGKTAQTDTLLNGDGKAYTWMTGEGGVLGYVTTLKTTTPAATSGAVPAAAGNGTAAASQNYQMSCKSWKVEASKFDVPSGVNFQSFPGL